MPRDPVGVMLKQWRVRRRLSQLDLSIAAGVSTRHLSFVETGRAKPSPELVLSIAHHLDVPLRERNTLLLAAGYAPRFGQAPLDSPEMAAVRDAVQRMLDAHDPYPGVVIDRQWNVLLANAAARSLLGGVPAHAAGRPPNVFRACLHPEGLAPLTTNFADWAAYLVGQLRRSIVLTGDPELEAIHDEVMRHPGVADGVAAAERHESAWDQPQVLVPLRLRIGDVDLSLFTTLTTFGTPRDVTLEELAIELFFPADEATATTLRAMGAAAAEMR